MSDHIILDTNIVSYSMKGHQLAETYMPHLQGQLLAITFVTVGELYFGAEKKTSGVRRSGKISKRRCAILLLSPMTMKSLVAMVG